MKKIFTAVLALTLFISCSKDDETNIDYVTKNEKDIIEFIAKNNLNAQRTNSGLYYVINDPGAGAQPTAASNVTVAYKGTFLNGQIFDQSSNTGTSFGLNQVIQGWTEGIPYFKTGGSGILLVPAHLGYGNYNNRGIPGGSVLIFDVKLISVNTNPLPN